MKKVILSLLTVATIFTACEKYDQADEISSLESTVSELRSAINSLGDALAASTALLQANIDANSSDIAGNANGIQSNLDAIVTNYQALSESDSLNLATFNASISGVQMNLSTAIADNLGNFTEEIALLQAALLEALALAGDETAVNTLQSQIDAVESLQASLQAAVASNQLASESAVAEAVVNASDALSDAVEALANVDSVLEGQIAGLSFAVAQNILAIAANSAAIDALSALSASYDAETGFLTITYADGSSYVTGDLRGAQGIQGIQGSIGAVGPMGAQGPIGPAGPQGIEGLQGLQGIAGLQGVQGIQGIVGENGIDGVDSTLDLQLTQYSDGSGTDVTLLINGTPYTFFVANGTDGADGAAGADGATGATGATGAQGIQGVAGPAGAQGPIGPQGAIGPAGPAGTSVSISVSQDADGNVTLVIGGDTFTIPAGTQGIQGLTGAAGADGAPGNDGLAGTPGSQGSQGIQGIQGPQGATGAAGDSPTITATENADGSVTITINGTDYVVAAGQDGAAGPQGEQGETGATGPAAGDTEDVYVSSTSSSTSGGESSTVNDGAPVISFWIGDTEYPSLADAQATVSAGSSATIITRSTQATLDQVSELFETVVTSYTVSITGVEDTPPLVDKADESVTTSIAPASSVAGTPIVSDSSDVYEVAADGADYITYSEYSGSGVAPDATFSFGEWNDVGDVIAGTEDSGVAGDYSAYTSNGDGTESATRVVVYTTTGNMQAQEREAFSTIAAYSYVETRVATVVIVGDADAVPPVAEDLTRTVNVAAQSTQLANETQTVSAADTSRTETETDTRDEAVTGFIAPTVSVATGFSGHAFASVLKDSDFNDVSGFTPSTGGNPATGFTVSFVIDAPGSYFFYAWASSTHFAADGSGTSFNAAAGFTVTVADDGTYTVVSL